MKKKKKKNGLDHRYEIIKLLFKAKQIHAFTDIFSYVPRTVVASDLKMKVSALNHILERPSSIVLETLYKIGFLCDLSEDEIYRLYYDYYRKRMEQKIMKTEKIGQKK